MEPENQYQGDKSVVTSQIGCTQDVKSENVEIEQEIKKEVLDYEDVHKTLEQAGK